MLRTVTRARAKSARNSLIRPATRSGTIRAFLPSVTASPSFESQQLTSRSFATVPIIYIEPSGEEKEVQAEVGKHLLDIAHDNNIELEGACGGELACATCHLIFEQEMYDTLPEKDEEEDDMLDLAFELTDTSRLGCQICVREDMAGMKVRIPDDGFN
jgi:ferredoxin